MIVAVPRPSGPMRCAVTVIFDLGGGVGAITQLVLQQHDPEAGIAFAIWKPAGHEETGQPALGICQGEEGIGHRRRAEPFVAA